MTEKERPAKLNNLLEKNIVDIEAGGLSSFAMSDVEDGKQRIFTWGCNDQGAIGMFRSCCPSFRNTHRLCYRSRHIEGLGIGELLRV